MKRLGCAPRFTTPNHPAGNGLIERYNRVFKNSLHHIIRTDPSNWDKYIPYMLFAYREVPNCTTGVSPFKLMYGREARGPLGVLKSSWCGDIAIPLNMEKSVVDYLQEQKINLERAAEEASLIASGMIFEDDADFGEVYSSPSYKNVCYWKEIFDQVDLRHLSEEVKCQILNLLGNHRSIFTGQVRVAKVGHHKIKLEDDKERKNLTCTGFPKR
ncbi:uncharacterized protein LOC129981408 [Argiope bruennichi]|uniref:uncharacterized protein LOC129981408 n=1 Tax=Argiope bruennichi TaxID=94029 RepID=UPI002493D153|nr:uncharacterized protein LOC129981408 [Argiope bruennichi]